MIIGEAWGEEEERRGRPFVGATGSVLHGLLKQVGIAPQETFLTNVFNLRPPGNNILGLCGQRHEAIAMYRPLTKGRYILAEFTPEVARPWN